VAIALAEIDSVRAVSVERSALVAHALVLGFTLGTLIAIRASSDD
jgi:hypothetical protein